MIDTLLTLATFGSSVVALATLIFVYKQLGLTRETVNLAKNEATRRLRSWVGFSFSAERINEGIGVALLDGTPLSPDEYTAKLNADPELQNKVDKFYVLCPYKNYGQIPAINLIFSSKTFTNKIPKTDDLDHSDDLGKIVLMPNECSTLHFDIPFAFYKRVLNGEIKIYALLRLDYEYIGGKGYHESVIEIRHDGIDLVSTGAG